MKQLKKSLILVTLLISVLCFGLSAEAAKKSKKTVQAGSVFNVKSYKKKAKSSNGNVAYVTKLNKNSYSITANNPGECKITTYNKKGKKAKVITLTVMLGGNKNVALGGNFDFNSYKKPKVSNANLQVAKYDKNKYNATVNGDGSLITYDKKGKPYTVKVTATRGTGYKQKVYRTVRNMTKGDSFSLVSYSMPTTDSGNIVITKTGDNTYTILANGDGTVTTTDLNGDNVQTVIMTTTEVNTRYKSFQPAETTTGTPHQEVTSTASKTVLQGDSYTFTSSKQPVVTGSLVVEKVKANDTGLDLYKVTVNGNGTLTQWNLNGDKTVTTITMTTVKKIPTKSTMTNSAEPSDKYVDKIEITYNGTTPIDNNHEFKNSEFTVKEYYADGTAIPTEYFRPWQIDVIGDTETKTFTINAWIIQYPRIKATITLPMNIASREVSETTVNKGETCYYKWDVEEVTIEVNRELAVPATLMNCNVKFVPENKQIISVTNDGIIKGLHAGTTNLTANFYRNSDNALIGTLSKTVYVTAKRIGLTATCKKDSVEEYYKFTSDDFNVVFNHADGSTSLCNKYILKYAQDQDSDVYNIVIISKDEQTGTEFTATLTVPYVKGNGKVLDSISANSKISEIVEDRVLSPADFNVYAIYTDGSNDLLDPAKYSLSDPIIEAGYVKVTITLKEDPTKTYDIEIPIKEGKPGSERVQTGIIASTTLGTVISGYQFKNSDFTVKAKYSNGTTSAIGAFTIDDVTQNTTKNVYIVTIKNGDFTDTLEIPYTDIETPEGKIQTGIDIEPKKSSYKDGEKPTSKDDFTVYNVFSDGSREETTNYEFRQATTEYPYESVRLVKDKNGTVVGEIWEVTATQGDFVDSCYVEIIYPYITGIDAVFVPATVTLEVTDTDGDGKADSIIDHAFTNDEFEVVDQYSDGTTVPETNFLVTSTTGEGAPVYNDEVGQYEVLITDTAHGYTKTVRIPATNAADVYDVLHPQDLTPVLNGVDFAVSRTEIYVGENIADYATVLLHYSDGVTVDNAGNYRDAAGNPYTDTEGTHPYDPSKFSCTFTPQSQSGVYTYTMSYDGFTSREMQVTVLNPARIIQSITATYDNPYIIAERGFLRDKINVVLHFLDGHDERYTDFSYTGETNPSGEYYPNGGGQATTTLTLNNLDQFENNPVYSGEGLQVSAPSYDGNDVKDYSFSVGGAGYGAGNGADLSLPSGVSFYSVKNQVLTLKILSYEQALNGATTPEEVINLNACEIDCPDEDEDEGGVIHTWTLNYPTAAPSITVSFTVYNAPDEEP